MPSAAHRWLVLWAARKLAHDGYAVRGFDGPAPQGGVWNLLPRPPDLAGVRPDVWGVHSRTGEYALGEAKTAQDLDTEHTRIQLRVFSSIRQLSGSDYCRLYIAAPRSAVRSLDKVLAQLQLLRAQHVIRLMVPDCLLEEAAL